MILKQWSKKVEHKSESLFVYLNYFQDIVELIITK